MRVSEEAQYGRLSANNRDRPWDPISLVLFSSTCTGGSPAEGLMKEGWPCTMPLFHRLMVDNKEVSFGP